MTERRPTDYVVQGNWLHKWRPIFRTHDHYQATLRRDRERVGGPWFDVRVIEVDRETGAPVHAYPKGQRENPRTRRSTATRRNPSARETFDRAFRAHRAWDTRRIPIDEFHAATRSSMPAVHAEEAHKARSWKLDTPARLAWKRDSAGRLDAYLGGGTYVTVMASTERWHAPGYLAVIDRLGIGGAPKYVDARGRAEFGAVPGRTIVFSSESAAKAAASRYLLRKQAAHRGKSVGEKIRSIERKR